MASSSPLSGFSQQVQDSLEEFIEKHSAPSPHRKIAVFDADGTLWRGDLGEAFIQYQLANDLAPKAPRAGAWETYFKNSIITEKAAEAYGWLAQWNEGMSETKLRKLTEEFFDTQWKQNIFVPMQSLVAAFQKVGFETWVISGSMRWVVEAGAAHFNIPRERVRGSSVAVRNGVLTGAVDYDIPYREGKARLIASHLKDSPLFGAGNTYWDKELIQTSTELGLAVYSEHQGEVNYESEQKLQELAKKQGWLSQRF